MQVKLLIMSNISKHLNLWKAVMGSHYTCDTFLLNIIALGMSMIIRHVRTQLFTRLKNKKDTGHSIFSEKKISRKSN